MQRVDLDELKTESILAIAKNMRLGYYGLQAHDEICQLRVAIKQAADMLPANAACGVLRAALVSE